MNQNFTFVILKTMMKQKTLTRTELMHEQMKCQLLEE